MNEVLIHAMTRTDLEYIKCKKPDKKTLSL